MIAGRVTMRLYSCISRFILFSHSIFMQERYKFVYHAIS